jgi:hypothetical protein
MAFGKKFEVNEAVAEQGEAFTADGIMAVVWSACCV